MTKKTYLIPHIETTHLRSSGIICAGSTIVTLGVTISSEGDDPANGR